MNWNTSPHQEVLELLIKWPANAEMFETQHLYSEVNTILGTENYYDWMIKKSSDKYPAYQLIKTRNRLKHEYEIHKNDIQKLTQETEVNALNYYSQIPETPFSM